MLAARVSGLGCKVWVLGLGIRMQGLYWGYKGDMGSSGGCIRIYGTILPFYRVQEY